MGPGKYLVKEVDPQRVKRYQEEYPQDVELKFFKDLYVLHAHVPILPGNIPNSVYEEKMDSFSREVSQGLFTTSSGPWDRVKMSDGQVYRVVFAHTEEKIEETDQGKVFVLEYDVRPTRPQAK